MTTASPDALEALLAVQAIDTHADQLRHRREHLPARADLAATQAQLAELERRAGAVRAERRELSAAEKRLEDEIAMVRDKAKQADAKLYSGTVNVPRELTALQDDIESLQRRQRQLEDEELELMEQGEPLDAQLAVFDAQQATLDEQAAASLAVITEEEAAIDAELAALDAQRADAVAPVPADLLTLYDKLRRGLGGIAVARLHGNRCDGCHLTLSAVDVDRIRHEPDDVLVQCTECGRILVRA